MIVQLLVVISDDEVKRVAVQEERPQPVAVHVERYAEKGIREIYMGAVVKATGWSS